MSAQDKSYNSISPSAKSLLLMKGYTNIPYAKEAAALMQGPEVFDLSFDDKDFWFWIRVMHFENRYWTIDQLLKKTSAKNILELSSGYSLRGMAMCADKDVHYIDTDLEEVIHTKQKMVTDLGLGKNLQGRLDFLPLNALDVPRFTEIVNSFEDGPITIVNEGLLMYLNTGEKKQLCDIIYNVLKQRGGCWITADIYIKQTAYVREQMQKMQSKSESAFFEQHNIEENKFDSYEQAEAFFNQEGFELVEEAIPDYQSLSVVPHLMKTLPPEARDSKDPPPKIQATWMLKVSS